MRKTQKLSVNWCVIISKMSIQHSHWSKRKNGISLETELNNGLQVHFKKHFWESKAEIQGGGTHLGAPSTELRWRHVSFATQRCAIERRCPRRQLASNHPLQCRVRFLQEITVLYSVFNVILCSKFRINQCLPSEYNAHWFCKKLCAHRRCYFELTSIVTDYTGCTRVIP